MLERSLEQAPYLGGSAPPQWILMFSLEMSYSLHQSFKLTKSMQGLPHFSFNKVDLQTARKADRWSSGGIFTSFYLRDLCLQADCMHKAGPVVAAGEIVILHLILQICQVELHFSSCACVYSQEKMCPVH